MEITAIHLMDPIQIDNIKLYESSFIYNNNLKIIT